MSGFFQSLCRVVLFSPLLLLKLQLVLEHLFVSLQSLSCFFAVLNLLVLCSDAGLRRNTAGVWHGFRNLYSLQPLSIFRTLGRLPGGDDGLVRFLRLGEAGIDALCDLATGARKTTTLHQNTTVSNASPPIHRAHGCGDARALFIRLRKQAHLFRLEDTFLVAAFSASLRSLHCERVHSSASCSVLLQFELSRTVSFRISLLRLVQFVCSLFDDLAVLLSRGCHPLLD